MKFDYSRGGKELSDKSEPEYLSKVNSEKGEMLQITG
jgi:hypothetical protein